MQYRTKPVASSEPYVLLLRREWDDAGYQTSFEVCYVEPNTAPKSLGVVKILQRGATRTVLPDVFEVLTDDYCSWVQSDAYSKQISGLKEQIGCNLRDDLRDLMSLDEHERKLFEMEPGFEKSLIRLTSARYLYSFYFGRLERKVEVRVVAVLPGFDAPHDVMLDFDVDHPLRRIAAIVGENGTGKTQFLDAMARSLAGMSDARVTSTRPFAQVVVISCNPFDQYMIPTPLVEGSYRYVGPRSQDSIDVRAIPHDIATWIPEIRSGVANWQAWNAVLSELGLGHLHGLEGDALAGEIAKLGAGYKHACLSFAGMLRHLEIGALVLFDEPENHTHPRLLSAMLRAFRATLALFDAFGVIATHSPLVLQEFPASQIRVLRCVDATFPRFAAFQEPNFGAPLDEILRRAFGVDYGKNNFDIAIRSLVAKIGISKFRELMQGELTLAAEIVLDEIEEEQKETGE
ncbi:MAG: AAA family ATPase [Deltaproteobacteria bacterium]|nr:AAA family ATPase [Deltaproteobacteria bacterium]